MSIQERLNPDQLNIHQFQETPEGRPELPFDVNRTITPEIRKKIEDTLNAPQDQETHINLVGSYKILWPDANIESKLNNNDLIDLWQRILYLNLTNRSKKISSMDIQTLKSIIIYSPSVDIELSWHDVEFILKDNPNIKYTPSFWADIVIINPEWIKRITPEQLAEMRLKVEQIKAKTHLAIAQFSNEIVGLRLIDPTYKPNITKEEWSILSDQLEVLDGVTVLHIAKQMKIMSAHTVTVTEPGVIDIQMYPPEDINQLTPPLPEQRKF